MRNAENEVVQLNATKEIIGDPELINIGGQKENPVLYSFIHVANANTINNEPIEDNDDE